MSLRLPILFIGEPWGDEAGEELTDAPSGSSNGDSNGVTAAAVSGSPCFVGDTMDFVIELLISCGFRCVAEALLRKVEPTLKVDGARAEGSSVNLPCSMFGTGGVDPPAAGLTLTTAALPLTIICG